MRLDARGFEAFYPGPGHTADNIVVAWPSQGIVFGGCLLEAATADNLGFTHDADLGLWPAAVRRVAERYPQPDAIVPGHSPIDVDAFIYQHTLGLLAP